PATLDDVLEVGVRRRRLAGLDRRRAPYAPLVVDQALLGAELLLRRVGQADEVGALDTAVGDARLAGIVHDLRRGGLRAAEHNGGREGREDDVVAAVRRHAHGGVAEAGDVHWRVRLLHGPRREGDRHVPAVVLAVPGQVGLRPG